MSRVARDEENERERERGKEREGGERERVEGERRCSGTCLRFGAATSHAAKHSNDSVISSTDVRICEYAAMKW